MTPATQNATGVLLRDPWLEVICDAEGFDRLMVEKGKGKADCHFVGSPDVGIGFAVFVLDSWSIAVELDEEVAGVARWKVWRNSRPHSGEKWGRVVREFGFDSALFVSFSRCSLRGCFLEILFLETSGATPVSRIGGRCGASLEQEDACVATICPVDDETAAGDPVTLCRRLKFRTVHRFCSSVCLRYSLISEVIL